jgi:hypothetical protein
MLRRIQMVIVNLDISRCYLMSSFIQILTNIRQFSWKGGVFEIEGVEAETRRWNGS